jgi:hypothetical protein
MAIEQVPGTETIKLSQTDDMFFTFNIPFTNIALYTFTLTVQEYNEGSFVIPTVLNQTSTSAGTLQALFYASTTSLLGVTAPDRLHTFKLKYIDDNGLSRRFIEGAVEVI